jgi:hypothetical protein
MKQAKDLNLERFHNPYWTPLESCNNQPKEVVEGGTTENLLGSLNKEERTPIGKVSTRRENHIGTRRLKPTNHNKNNRKWMAEVTLVKWEKEARKKQWERRKNKRAGKGAEEKGGGRERTPSLLPRIDRIKRWGASQEGRKTSTS